MNFPIRAFGFRVLCLIYFSLFTIRRSYNLRRLVHLSIAFKDFFYDWLIVAILERATFIIEQYNKVPSRELNMLNKLIHYEVNLGKRSNLESIKSGIQVNFAERTLSLDQILSAVATHKKNLFDLSQFNQELGFKIIDGTYTSSFGHMAHGLEMLKFAQDLGYFSEDNLLILKTRTPNDFYLSLWREFFKIIDSTDRQIAFFKSNFPGNFLTMDSLPQVNPDYWRFETYNFLSKEHEERFGSTPSLSFLPFKIGINTFLESKGLESDRWFVTFHVRNSKSVLSRSASNAEISTYFPAMESIAQRGGVVVVTGDADTRPLPSNPLIVDQRGIHTTNPVLSIGFFAECRFLVATSSGPMSVPPTFGKPVLFTNNPHIRFTFRYKGVHIPKLLYSKSKKRIVYFEDHFAHPASWGNRDNFEDDIERLDNTPDEILAAIDEMFAGNFTFSKNELTLRRDLRVSDLSSAMPISHTFLAKYSHLI